MTAIQSVPHQLPLSVRLDDSATFDNFYLAEGAINAAAVSSLKSLTSGDFLYLWGSGAAGCSHLLQACCHWFSQRAIYLPLGQLAREDPADVLADAEQMSLVILDDLNLVAGRANWSEQIFHLYNRIQDLQGILVVAADAPPSALATPLADLESRLSAMEVHKINALEHEEKSAALILRARNRGMHMPEKVALFLLNHYSRDMSDQISILDQLDRYSLEAQSKLSIPLVKQVLENSYR